MLVCGVLGSKMVIWWILLSVIHFRLVKDLVNTDSFTTYF